MSEKKSLIERRKHARIALCIEYRLTINNREYSGETGNISLGGVYLETITPEMPHDQLSQTGRISLTLGQDKLETACLVVFIGGGAIPYPAGIGISFPTISDSDADRLKAFIMQRL